MIMRYANSPNIKLNLMCGLHGISMLTQLMVRAIPILFSLNFFEEAVHIFPMVSQRTLTATMSFSITHLYIYKTERFRNSFIVFNALKAS